MQIKASKKSTTGKKGTIYRQESNKKKEAHHG
jgi:hypothetical protein